MSREGFPGGCNPADVLYKLAHSRGIKPPVFEMISEQGPPHARTFTWSCSFYEGKYHTMAAGRSKKEAKNAVAKALIEQIDLSELPQKPKAGPPSRGNGNRGPKRKMNEMDEMEAHAENGMNGQKNKNKNKNKRKRGSMGGMDFNMDSGFMMGFGPMNAFGPAGPMGMGMHMGMGMGMPFCNPMFMGMHPMGGMPPQSMGMDFPNRMMHSRPVRLNRDDHLVISKHKSIYPTKDELALLLKLAEITERSLKRVSDKFCMKEEPAEENGEKEKKVKKVEADREILGVARVGDLSKGLLLTGDRAVNLVVLCRSKPTMQLLQKICSGVEEDLKARPESEKKGPIQIEDEELEVHLLMKEGGFCVSLNKEDSEQPYAVMVNLTCTKMRGKEPVKEEKDEAMETTDEVKKENEEAEEEKEENEEEEIEEDPVDMLDKDKCLEALANLRRAKWFSSVAAGLENCVESIRVFKDLARRAEQWKPLGDWAVELLVERAVSSSRQALTPSNAILRVLEVVASGVVTDHGTGIKDPCERSTEDVFKHLTRQQKEDFTASAQDMVRKIHYRKIHEMLDMEKPKPREFKKKKPKGEAEAGDAEADTSAGGDGKADAAAAEKV